MEENYVGKICRTNVRDGNFIRKSWDIYTFGTSRKQDIKI